jgi:uroporphyrin-III C-methyltransferase/precorrin-2 dehydrogenase/sirohydrochlorin ferrochelatase
MVKSSGLAAVGRRKFWQLFAAKAMAATGAPSERDLDVIIDDVRACARCVGDGFVTFVGVDPLDHELISLRALRALRTADVVLFDDKVPAVVLDFSRREARKIQLANKDDRGERRRACDLAFDLAKGGKLVVQLVCGGSLDLLAMGRSLGADRIDAMAFEVIPASMAASFGGVGDDQFENPRRTDSCRAMLEKHADPSSQSTIARSETARGLAHSLRGG